VRNAQARRYSRAAAPQGLASSSSRMKALVGGALGAGVTVVAVHVWRRQPVALSATLSVW
jgi:hypothetical protein